METKRGNNVRVHFGNAAPAPDTKAYHDMFDAASIGYGGTERIYARSHNGQPSIIVTPAGGEHEP
ncbi:hypothetical protein [Pelagimonas phthalicica]|uniref:hypothetical protein n=1 Tax=Pelagimonas phthalicica TaxID=1037362 RepID=UPI00105F6D5D|nr:hypothetical protein [Pelagimonas phthalicica]